MKWYKSLSIHRRITLKGLSADICGLTWEDLDLIDFSMRDKIEMLHFKLSQHFDI